MLTLAKSPPIIIHHPALHLRVTRFPLSHFSQLCCGGAGGGGPTDDQHPALQLPYSAVRLQPYLSFRAGGRRLLPSRKRKDAIVGFSELFRARIHALNIRYLQNGSFDGNRMEDIHNTPFFEPFSSLESPRWSCGCFGARSNIATAPPEAVHS